MIINDYLSCVHQFESDNVKEFMKLPIHVDEQLHGVTSEELKDACMMFFHNCACEAAQLSEVSTNSLSRIQIEALVKNKPIDEFIAQDAKKMLRERNQEQQ